MAIDSENKQSLRLSIVEMQEECVQSRQTVTRSMAAFKRQELQYKRSQVQSEQYDRKALQALQNGDH